MINENEIARCVRRTLDGAWVTGPACAMTCSTSGERV